MGIVLGSPLNKIYDPLLSPIKLWLNEWITSILVFNPPSQISIAIATAIKCKRLSIAILFVCVCTYILFPSFLYRYASLII